MQASGTSVQFGEQQQTSLRGLLIIEKKHTSIPQKHGCYYSSILNLLLRTVFSPWSMHVPLRALHHIHLQILFFHGKVSHQWQINIFANTHKAFFCIPALTLQADVLKASSGLFGFFCLNGAMQSNAASPNRLPEYICSSRNSFLLALNSLITRSLLTLCSDHLSKSSIHQK